MVAISDPHGTNGTDPSYAGARQDISVVAGSAITNKMAVALVMATDGVMTAVPFDTDTHATGYPMGVALEDIASGGVGQVCVSGPCIVITPATGPSIGEMVVGTTTAGTADGVAADATTVGSLTHGFFMTDEIGTSNTCWAWISN